ncbi:unnamed protein product [Sphagnum jensenii]
MNSRETAGKKKKSLKEKLEEEADKKGKQQQVWGEVVEEEKADFWHGTSLAGDQNFSVAPGTRSMFCFAIEVLRRR